MPIDERLPENLGEIRTRTDYKIGAFDEETDQRERYDWYVDLRMPAIDPDKVFSYFVGQGDVDDFMDNAREWATSLIEDRVDDWGQYVDSETEDPEIMADQLDLDVVQFWHTRTPSEKIARSEAFAS